MANVNISVDVNPESKNLSVSINGQLVPDVEDVSIYSGRDESGELTYLDVSVRTYNKDDNGVVKAITYYVTGSKLAENAMANHDELLHNIEGFVGVEDDNSEVIQEIDQFFSTRK